MSFTNINESKKFLLMSTNVFSMLRIFYDTSAFEKEGSAAPHLKVSEHKKIFLFSRFYT